MPRPSPAALLSAALVPFLPLAFTPAGDVEAPARRPASPARRPGSGDRMRARGSTPGGSAAPPETIGAPRIVEATGWPADRWDALAVGSERGDVMQSHAWGEHKRRYGWDVRRFVVERDAAAIACVSVQVRSMAPGRLAVLGGVVPARYLYAARGPILLSTTERDVRATVDALAEIARDAGAAALTVDPAWLERGRGVAALTRTGFRRSPRNVQVSQTAMLVPLFADEQAQHKLVSKSASHSINRARRQGVTVERVDLRDPASFDDLEQFYEIFADTGRRKGFIVRDREYQLSQWAAIGAAGHAALWFACDAGRRVAGAIVLQTGERLVYHHAGSVPDADLGKSRANHLMQWGIMRWGAENGYRTYDLGGVDALDAPGLPRDSSHPLWNLFVFKSNLGARGVTYMPAYDYVPFTPLRAAWPLVRRFV